jgi:hypothetical protein
VNEPVDYLDGASTEEVKGDLHCSFGRGILKQRGIEVLSDTLAPGVNE